MTPGRLRALITTLFVACIAGMIATQIADEQQASMALGLIAAAGALVLVAVNAVTSSGAPADADLTRQIDEQVTDLVDRGATEVEIRRLVRNAIELGRRRSHGHQSERDAE